jgi:hypothetical protein
MKKEIEIDRKELNLYEKINMIMREIEYLKKDDKVITNTKTNAGYNAVSEEKVTSEIRKGLVKYGIVIVPIEQEHMREDEMLKDQYGNDKANRITTVNVKYKIVNIDNPEDYIIAASSGTGVDTQDKGVGKAMTYAYKYMLLRTFAIPTGDDPDKISSDLYSEQFKTEKEILKEKIKTYSNAATVMKKRNKKLSECNEEELKEILNELEGENENA